MKLALRIFAVIIVGAFNGCLPGDQSNSRSPKPNPSPANAMIRGAGAFQSGNFAEAAAQWRIAEAVYAAAGNSNARCDALINLAEAYVSLGKYPEAEQALRTAVFLADGNSDAGRVVSIYCALGNVYVATSRTDEANEILEKALPLAKSSTDAKLTMMVLDGIGTLRSCERRFPEAAQAFEQCAQLAHRSGNKLLEAYALANHARSAAWAGDDKTAFILCHRALDATGVLPAGHEKTRLLLSIGQTAGELAQPGGEDRQSRLDMARGAYHSALSLATVAGDKRSASYALGYEGRLDEIDGHIDAALGLTRQAILLAQQIEAPEVLYRWQWQAARLLKEKGQTTVAIREYSHAIETVSSVRQDLALGYGSLGPHESFRETVGPIYYELADLLLKQSGDAGNATASQALLNQARQTVELMKNAELDDYFQDPCTNVLKSKARPIENVDPGTAVLYLIPLADRTELLLGTTAGLCRVVVNVPAETLYAEVRQFRRGLENRTTRQYLKNARKLYDWLIAPIEPQLTSQHIDTLVFVPDGVLRNIPMAALHDGSNYLIKKYAIAVSPGLTIIDPRRISRPHARVLEAGLSEPVRGYPALHFVPRELNSVQSSFSGVILLDQRFIVSNIKTEMARNQFTIIHIASHAQSSSDVRKTFVVTYDSTLSIDELQRLLRPGQSQDHAIDLLTLSACQTAAGDDRAALGLAGIAIKAGAKSTLATLWSVNDEAGSILVGDFYDTIHRDPSTSVAKALQHAQLKLMSELRYRHPGYWAPYIIVGNWL